MAHSVEPMDIDNIESDFDNKENSIQHSNVYTRCTEKGYEELDVSELNMKLRYSITPASSPMSKSYTANCTDNRGLESGDDSVNSNLTRSLHSAISKGDVSSKSIRSLPLQQISTDPFVDGNRNASVLRPLDASDIADNNVTITVMGGNDADENMSFPSSSSSTAQTPEATTPTKDIPRNDGGSPIMRGLKSVLNMFRSSQSPIPPADNTDGVTKQVLSPAEITSITPDASLKSTSPAVLASTPIAANKHKENNMSKRSSPLKESLVFNEDLEKELLWKDETTILFSQEKIPIHKLFFQQGSSNIETAKKTEIDAHFNSTVEYMDISANDSMIKDCTITELQAEAIHANESDVEFVDCETTFTNDKPDSINIQSKPSSTVTEMITAISAANFEINSGFAVKEEPRSDAEDFPVTALGQPDIITSGKDDIVNIPQVKSEPVTQCGEHESYINTTNNVSEFTQELNELINVVNLENDVSINKINDDLETYPHLDGTFDTPNSKDENSTVENIDKETQSDVKLNEFQADVSISGVETKLLETSEGRPSIVADSTAFDADTNAKLVDEIKDIPVSEINIISTNAESKDRNQVNMLYATDQCALDLPANIPLPDDEDVENEKSIGAVILFEEGTVSHCLDNNSTNVTQLELNQVETMPNACIAKSIDENDRVNDSFALQNFVASDVVNKSEPIEGLKSKEVNNVDISVEIELTQEKKEPIDTLVTSTNKSIDKNNVTIEAQNEDVVLTQSEVDDLKIKQNLNISLEQVADIDSKLIQPVSHTLLESQTNVPNTIISVINDANAEESKVNIIVTPHVVECSVATEETRHERQSEINIEAIATNDIASSADRLDSKELQEQLPSVNEFQISQVTLNKITVTSDVVIENTLTENAKGIDVESVQIKEILEKHLSPVNIATEKATSSSPNNIICDLPHNSKTLNNEQNQHTITEVTELKQEKTEQIANNENADNNDEEIILSESNSPYVSLASQIDLVPDELEIPFSSQTKVVLTPPSSPKIVSKGYHFNFDEIDDPFATKTKIRMSPTPDTPEKPLKEDDNTFADKRHQDVNKNRRKSQPERKKPIPKNISKKKMNSTFCGPLNVSNTTSNIKPEDCVCSIQTPSLINKSNASIDKEDNDDSLPSVPVQINSLNVAVTHPVTSKVMPEQPIYKDIAKEENSIDVRDIDTAMEVDVEEYKSSVESLHEKSTETKNTSSSEHSTYYSAGTSSGEGAVSRNVFNLPEIDDIKFNPLVTKSPTHQLPTTTLNASSAPDILSQLLSDATFTENPFETKSKMRQSPPPNLHASSRVQLISTKDSSCSSDSVSEFTSDSTFTKNPFKTKCKIWQSPPPSLNATATLNASQELSCPSETELKIKSDVTFTEDPFETKSKMRQSPPPSLNATATLNASQELSCPSETELKIKSDVTFTEDPFETKSKMRQSHPQNLNATATLNASQEIACPSDTESKIKSDATFTEDPFETKSKMRQSPPPCLNATATLNSSQQFSCPSDTESKIKSDVTFTENPFVTKSKMRQSPPLSLNATQELPCTENVSKLKPDATFTEVDTEDLDLNKDLESKYVSTFEEKECANISSTSCSSKATDEKDLTVREVHTEDEDTIEGPFLEAEDSINDDKMSDFDGDDVDMMQFSELPAQGTEENVDGGELFIDAEAFEFLLNQNKSNVVADSGKESLFLKFDPLFAKRMSSDGVLAALNKKRQSTPKKMTAVIQMDATFDKSIAGPSSFNTTHEVVMNSNAEESHEDFNVTVSKPMMVVTPAVNPVLTPRNRTATPPSSNRRSITFTSPAIAVIDRLLSLSANNSLVGHDTTVTHMSREQAEADLALTQLRELLAEKEINVYNLRTESKELKDRLSSMESQMRILESEGKERLEKINGLNEKLAEKAKLNKSMAAVVEEYERTIASLIAETEQDKKRNNEERIRLIKERDEQTAHLASMEVSFSDLHSKYEKSKQIILTCKANEDAYKKSIKEFEENLSKMQSNYELLKQHATSKLNHANQELEKMNRSHEAEVLKLNAMIKRKELHLTSLEETLAQKTKANEELTAICDELINKVG